MGVFLHKAANTSVPDSLAERTVKENPGGAGCLFIQDGKIQTMKLTVATGYGPAGVKEIFKLLHGLPAWFHFATTTTEEDFQPYTTLSNSGEALLYLMGEGDFSPFSKTDGSHPDLFYAVQDYFLPKFSVLYNQTKDISKLISTVRDTKIWQMDMKNAMLSGTMVLFASNGQYIRFQKGEDHVYSWGYTTNPYDYKETEFPDKGVATKAKDMVSALSALLTPSSAPSSKIADKPAAAPATPPTATAIPADGKTNEQLIEDAFEDRFPPTHFVQVRNRRQWYKGILGAKNGVKLVLEDGTLVNPQDVKLSDDMVMKSNKGKGLAVRMPVKKAKTVHSLQDVGSALTAATPASAEKQLADADARRANKDTTTHNIPAATNVSSIPVERVIDDKTAKNLDTFFQRKDVKTMLDMSARKVPYDPKEIMGKTEIKIKTFAESRGLKDTRQLSHLSRTALLELGKLDIESLRDLCDDWRALAMQYAPAYDIVVAAERRKTAQEIIAERKLAKEAAKKAS